MNRKREAIFMGIGILAGLALSGPAAQAATEITAKPSTQPIYVDGQRISMTAYNISGNNYVRLRDIGSAVDFGVTYDAATNSVYIDSAQPYREELPAASPGPTEESVQAALAQLKQTYPTGTVYGAFYRPNDPLNRPFSNCDHCAGWAMLCSDAAFGTLPWKRITDPSWEQIRPGDLVRYDNERNGHVIVVIKIDAEWVTFTDSGTTQKAYWGGQYPRWWLEEQPGLTLYTRYPE